MRASNRSLLSLLVAASFASSLCVAAEEHDHAGAAPGASISAVKGGAWSDPSVWSGNAVPKAGDLVTIGAGLDLVLDVSPPELNGINLFGKLSFADDK